MILQIRKEHLDSQILDPLSKQVITFRFIKSEMYEWYFRHGFDLYFEYIEEYNIHSNPILEPVYMTFPRVEDDIIEAINNMEDIKEPIKHINRHSKPDCNYELTLPPSKEYNEKKS